MMPRQFQLRSLFIVTAIVAVGCLVGAIRLRQHNEHERKKRQLIETLDKFDGPRRLPLR